jgi:queuosine precursor transporter
MKLDARLTLFITLVAVFLTCLLIGNLIGGKLTYINFLGRDWIISVGEIPFPLTFILTDIINEFYGRETARRITLLGFAMTGLAILLIRIADLAVWFPGSQMTPAAYDNVFLGATFIQIASMIAFLTAQYVDIGVFFLIKRLTGPRLLWLRATGSTAVSQLIDTIVILTIAFGPLGAGFDAPTLFSMITTSYLVKVIVAIGVTPIIYALHGLLERVWHLSPLPVEAKAGDIGGSEAPPEA